MNAMQTENASNMLLLHISYFAAGTIHEQTQHLPFKELPILSLLSLFLIFGKFIVTLVTYFYAVNLD